jgi:hypothetical protein
MEEKKNDRSEKVATTNFSLLGWILDKFKKRPDTKESVDLTLEE